MRRIIAILSSAALFVGLLGTTVVPVVSAAACTPTGFVRDGMDMTAALINPAGTVTGDVDATGCNVGVYYDSGLGTVSGANIHGANYFGVLVNGDTTTVSVTLTGNSIHDIGETPLNGTQHGIAIYLRAFLGGSITGQVSGNSIWNYQKGGIVANGRGTTATISSNQVTGQGPVDYIAQNGIQVGYGAIASVKSNVVTGNSYTGANYAASGGIVVVGGPFYGTCPDGNACPYTTGTQIVGNTVTGNDVGVYLTNWDATYPYIPTVPTNVKATNNVISDAALNNTTGFDGTVGYQAGISDVGNRDKIINNAISGLGYDTAYCGTAAYCYPIDVWATNTKVHANTIQ